jgi:hypothetical protein
MFVILALAYSIVNPLHEATDELRHYRFVRILATSGRLPVQGQEPCRSQSHHPPLFYAAGALATSWIDTGREICATPPENPFWAYRYWEVGRDNKNQYLHGPDEAFPWRGEALAAHIIRAINVLIGAGVVWLTWATGRLMWPDRPAVGLAGAALVAFNPMFLYMAGAINNDIIAALAGSAILYACARLLRSEGLSWRWGAALGALYGLALMSKFNLAATIVLIEASVTLVAWRRGQWSAWLVANGLILLVAGALAGWWFGRNLLLYCEPTGFEEVTELWGARDPRQSVALAISELPYAWTTLWGRFGYGQIPLPEPIYDGLKAVATAGLLGAALAFIRGRSRPERAMLILLAADAALYFLVLFNYMLVSPAGPNGRFFFPALSALAILIAVGLLEIGRALFGTGERRRAGAGERAVAAATILGMAVLALAALLGYLRPAYARPPARAADAPVPGSGGARFDTLATLSGYRLSASELSPGDPIEIELYWQVDGRPPGNYLLFVHLVDENGVIIAQRDTHPGLGNYPTSQWRPGDRFVDTIRLYLPETAYAPSLARLQMGLYAPEGYRLAVSALDGRSLGDSFPLGPIAIVPLAGHHPNRQDQNFEGRLRLVGYEYDRRSARPGGELIVALYWEALTDAPAGRLRLRLLGQDGAAWSEVSTSLDGAWREGETFETRATLAVPAGAPAGTYEVELALLDATDGKPLNIIAEDGHWIDSRLLLARLSVWPEGEAVRPLAKTGRPAKTGAAGELDPLLKIIATSLRKAVPGLLEH